MLALQFVLAAQACELPVLASSATTMTVPCEGTGVGTASCLIQCQKTADQIKPSVDFHFDALPTPNVWPAALSVPPASRMAGGRLAPLAALRRTAVANSLLQFPILDFRLDACIDRLRRAIARAVVDAHSRRTRAL